MVVTMHKMTSTNGVGYLLRSVAAGDGQRELGTPLTRYYTESGTPPGVWLGNGVALLGLDAVGRLAEGDAVTEDALRLLVGEGRDPITRLLLGKAPATYTQPPRHRVADSRDSARGIARSSGRATPRRQAVAGFDFTFSPPKSVSVLWGVADAGTQSLIAEAHHAAVRDILDVLERRVAVTRIGTNGVARVKVEGVVAAAYYGPDRNRHRFRLRSQPFGCSATFPAPLGPMRRQSGERTLRSSPLGNGTTYYSLRVMSDTIITEK